MVFTFRLTVSGIEPPIYRILKVPSDLNLEWFHDALQLSIGFICMDDYEFRFPDGRRIGISEWNSTKDYEEARGLKKLESAEDFCVDEVFKKAGEEVSYLCDVNSEWEFSLILEDIDSTEHLFYPLVVDGKRNNPREEFIGAFAYDHAIEAFLDPEHSYHKDALEWLGGSDFDPEFFDKDEANESLLEWYTDSLERDSYGFKTEWQAYRQLPLKE
jgi:hypothetical protein